MSYLTMLIHGESKVGKTSLLATAPKPLLVLDSEAGGMRFVKGKILEWDPHKQQTPKAGKGWDICRVKIKSLADMERVYQALSQSEHPFISVGLDSITEYQARLKRDVNPEGLMDQQGWGRVLSKMEDLVWQYQDLVEHPKYPIQVFVVIAGTRMRDGKFRPYLQGQSVTQLPYKVDVNGFLESVSDEDGGYRRALRIRGSQIHDIGERVHNVDGITPAGEHLADVVWDPDISRIFNQIHGEEQS